MKYKAVKVKGVKRDVHRIVMEEHLGRQLEFHEVVHHKDGNKANNAIENLEVMTREEHSRLHMIRLMKDSRRYSHFVGPDRVNACGVQKKNAKLRDEFIPLIKKMRQGGMTQQGIADVFGVDRTRIRAVLANKAWRHAG